MTTTRIPITLIDVPPGGRRLDPEWVEALAELFSSQGQQTPIQVIANGERFRLVYGRHRLAAGKSLGWQEIDGTVKEPEAYASEAEIVQAEITENLARRELSVLDKAVDIARWREAYNAAHTVSKGGRPKKGVSPEELTAKFCSKFSDVALKVLGISERSIFNALKIASIAEDIRQRISLLAIADNQSELMLLASETPARQERIAALLAAEPPQAGSIADAIAIIDRVPKSIAAPAWEKLSKGFSVLKPADQFRFFDLHEAAIQQWLKGRQS